MPNKRIDISKHIQERLAVLPSRPGVYLFKKLDEIIYVGKANKLSSRVPSYFRKSNTDIKVSLISKNATDIEWIVTDTPVDALVLENTLIKKHRPRYNIELKDNKRYPYIHITTWEEFPRIEVTRDYVPNKGKYFGPYVNVGPMRATIRTICEIFKIRTCNRDLGIDKISKQCLNYQIEICDAPCAFPKELKDSYSNAVSEVLLFLGGKRNKLISILKEEMLKLSADQKYEEASKIKKKWVSLKALQQKQRMSFQNIEERDIIGIAKESKDICCSVIQVREGLVTGRNHFFLKSESLNTNADILEKLIQSIYSADIFTPKEIMLPDKATNQSVIEEWLEKETRHKVKILNPIRGENVRLLELSAKNARVLLDEYLIKKANFSSRVPASILALKKDLNLEKSPRIIEAYDISHLSGSDTVGAKIAFVDAKPKKKLYRKYIIKEVKIIDDFASMQEVLKRRFSEENLKEDPAPDLILIDGGKGQLSSAVEILKSKNLFDKVKILGLAKRLEEVFLPGDSLPLMIKKSSPSLKLLQQLRDEVHRFVITFHRDRRNKRVFKSELDNIKGIGEKTRNVLLKELGSVTKIKSLNQEQMIEKGIKKSVAKKVFDFFNSISVTSPKN